MKYRGNYFPDTMIKYGATTTEDIKTLAKKYIKNFTGSAKIIFGINTSSAQKKIYRFFYNGTDFSYNGTDF
jgi:hypothetical protein